MKIQKLDALQVMNLLPDRDPHAHKGCFGKILLLCGSLGYTGAPALATMGALRSGAGLVYLGVPQCIYSIEAVKLTEPVIFPLPDDGRTYSPLAANVIQEKLADMDAVLMGCGCGKSEGVHSLLETVLREYSGPVVLDADGINCLGPHKDIMRERDGATILTPHMGEFHRLCGRASGEPIEAASAAARELGCIVLLKGHETVVTDGNTAYLNTTGNPGMAAGGSGDMLAGMIVSFLGQGIAPLEAAACAAWLHGSAGDICAREIGQYGMLPTDMLQILPRLLK